MKQTELVLFGGQTIAANVAKVISVKPRYAYEKVKKGKKWVVVRTADNEPVLAKDEQGNHIKTADRITLLPRSSKEGPNLKDVTGLSGQGLFVWEREVRDGMCDAAIAELLRLRANGQYTFGSEVRNARTGAITLTVKPVFGGKSIAVSTDEEIQKELERRGYKVEKTGTKDNGLPDATDQQPAESKPATKPKAPKAPKAA